MVWLHGEDEYEEFLVYLNSIHPTIKFTSNHSQKEIEFLDVLVKNENGLISTDLFTKKTDTHQYLHFKSCHTYHTKCGIPYGQALRLKIIISDNDKFELRCNELRDWLVDRGYDGRMVAEQIGKAKERDREELINHPKKEQKSDERPNLVLRYHPALSDKVHKILKQHQTILSLNEEHRKVFNEIPRVTYRRAKNLKDGLVCASLPKHIDTSSCGSGGCGKKRCQGCLNIESTKSFANRDGSRAYEIRKGPLTCDTPCVVYLLQCRTCRIQYVGSTETRFRLRYNNYKSAHRSFIKRRDLNALEEGKNIPQQSLHAHFAQNDHNGIDRLS